MSKGAVVLSAVPSVVGGTLGQLVEHDQDKNIIVIYTAGSYSTVSGGAAISHTHGSAPSITGSIGVTSLSNAWSISIPDFLTTAALSTHIHGSINTVSVTGSVLTNSSASSGLTLGVPAWLTTAANSTHTHPYAGTGTSATGANITLNSNGLAINVTGTGAGDGYNILAAGTQTANTVGTVLFSNSNSFTFGMSGGSRITASFSQSTHAHPYLSSVSSSLFLTTARASSDALGLVTAQTNVTWTADSRGLSINAEGYAGTTTAGTNVGLTVNSLGVRASVDTAGLTAAGDGVNILSAGSIMAGTVQTILFDDSNGISFGMDTDSTAITASHNAYSATSMFSASFLNTAEPHIRQLVGGASSYTSGTVHFVGTNNVTVTYDASSILFSGANTHAEQTGISGIAGSGASTVTAGTVQFANSNDVSFGLNGSTMTASVSFPAQTTQPVAVSDSATSFEFSTLSFGASNGLTLYQTNSSIVGSYTVPTQSTQPVAISDSATSFTFSTLTLGTENGLTLYHSNSSIVGSYTVPTQSDQPRVISLNGTTGELSLSGASNISVSALNGSTITIYGPSNILNSFSIGGNTGTTGSSAVTGGGYLIAGGSNITLSQSNNSISIHGASGGIRLGGSDTTYTSGTVMLSGEANMTIGTTEVAGIQYLKLSAGGGTATGGADGYNWLVAGTQTANTAGYVSLADSNGISFGMTDNSIITASYLRPEGFTTGSTAGTDIVGTLDTNGLSLGVPAYVTVPGTSTLYFSDSNGVTFGSVTGASATTITASISSFNGLDSVGFTTTSNTGSLITGVLNTDGLYLSVPNYLTTAVGSDATSLLAHTGFTSLSVTGSLMDGVHDTDGLYLAVPRYITTAMVSNAGTGFIGLNTAQSNVTWTVNSAGISFNANNYARTGVTTATTTGVSLLGTLNTGGLNLRVPNWITTAMLSNAGSGFAGTGFTTGTTGGASIIGTLSSNGLSMRIPNLITTIPEASVVFYSDSCSNITWGSSTNGSTTYIYATAGGGTGGGGGIMGLGNAATIPFTSGSVMLSAVNLTVNTSSTGASQYLQISAPAIGYLFFSNTNDHSWSSSVSGVSTSVYIIT